jgi:NO-binding membrane sensor protein with MHYT domain
MCAAMLTLEAIILALSVPVMISVEDVDTTLALLLGLGLAVLCVLVAGSLRRPQAYLLGHAIQVAAICLGFLVPIMFFVGLMFAALWFGAFFLGRKIEDDKARWAREGRPSAQDGD